MPEESSEFLLCVVLNKVKDPVKSCIAKAQNDWMGLCPNLLGSVIAMQAWMQHSPSEVVFATLRMTSVHKKIPSS